jgi:hypothetical protein
MEVVIIGPLSSISGQLKYFILQNNMTDAIVDWESIVHKNARSKEGEGAGNVDAILGDIIVIMSQGDRAEYKLPKSQVVGVQWSRSFVKSYFR